MQILMLSWEYPPRIVGGISRVVHDLAQELGRKGNDVFIVTCKEGEVPDYEEDKHVFVYRVEPYNVKPITFIDWVLQLNFSLAQKAIELINNGHNFDIIHLHDWLVAFAGTMLKALYPITQVCTIHATEHGRNSGIYNDVQKYISNVEKEMSKGVEKVIVNSQYMRNEVTSLFELPIESVHVIPNGVDMEKFNFVEKDMDFRRRFADDKEKIVFFVGRLVNQKGVHVLMDAIPKVLYYEKDVKFLIAGKGPELEPLKRRANEMCVQNKVIFAGYISDDELLKMYKFVDIAVFPSLYEPFGIVALEGMVAHVPVVVSNAGGFNEIIIHEKNGMKFNIGNSEMLAKCILDLLINKELVSNITNNSTKIIEQMYLWEGIAQKTLSIYEEAIDNRLKRENCLNINPVL